MTDAVVAGYPPSKAASLTNLTASELGGAAKAGGGAARGGGLDPRGGGLGGLAGAARGDNQRGGVAHPSQTEAVPQLPPLPQPPLPSRIRLGLGLG